MKSKNKILIFVILSALIFYLIFYLMHFYPLMNESLRNLKASSDALKTGYLNYSNYGYPSRGGGALISIISLVSGISLNPLFFSLIEIFLGILALFVIYSFTKNFDEKIKIMALIFTVVGFGGEYIILKFNFPHLTDFFFLPFLLYLDYKFMGKKEYFFVHFLILSALFLTHFWAAIVYLAYYALICLWKTAETRKIPKNTAYLSFMIFLFAAYFYFIPLIGLGLPSGIKEKGLLIAFIGIALLWALSAILCKIRVLAFFSRIKQKIIEKKERYQFWSAVFVIGGGMLIFVISNLISPSHSMTFAWMLKNSYLLIFSSLILVGLIEMISWDKSSDILKIIISWIFVCGMLFFLSFALYELGFSFNVLIAGRHWAYSVILGSIPVAAALNIIAKKQKKYIFCMLVALLVAISIVSMIPPLVYANPQELSLFDWSNSNLPEESFVFGDLRMSFAFTGLTDFYSFTDKNFFLKESKLWASHNNYAVWSEEYLNQGIILGDVLIVPATKKEESKFESALFDKVYSTGGVSLFRNKNI